jgi:hypothetical protein
VRPWIAALLASVVLSSCQEKLTSPGDCPALCPGGTPQVFDEILSPITGADSSFRGYVKAHVAAALLVSNGLNGVQERAIFRFPRRNDSISVGGTPRAYQIDSITFNFTLVARDTLLTGLQAGVYRLPPSIDTTTTFDQVEPGFVPSNLVATIDVPDSVNAGAIGARLRGFDVSRVAIPPADSGVLALGLRVDSPVATGLRLGGGSGTSFETHVTLEIPDTGAAKLRTITLVPTLSSYVTNTQPVDHPTTLAVGGEPSSRALLRFELPARLRDSATIVRATLELTPAAPIIGLPTDPVRLQARAVRADLGAKSPLNPPLNVVSSIRIAEDTLESGTDTASLEAVRLVELWLAEAGPPVLVLSLAPDLEAGSFSRPVFYSTLAPDPATHPRLRISYLKSFTFENP